MNLLKKVLALTLILCCQNVVYTACYGQYFEIKPLKKQLAGLRNEPEIADIYCKLSREYFRIRYDSALWYGEQAVKIARKNNLKETLAWSLLHTANVHRNLGNFTLCFEYLNEARSIFKSLNLSQQQWAQVYNIVGSAYYSSNDNDSSLHYFLKSMDAGGPEYLDPLAGLGHIYTRSGELDSALHIYSKVIATTQDSLLKALILTAASQVYFALNKPDTSIYLLNKSLRLSKKLGATLVTEGTLRHMATSYLALNKINEAKKLAHEALAINEAVGSIQNQANGYNQLAELAYREKNFDECIRQAKRAKVIGEQYAYHYIVAHASKNLFKAYLSKGDRDSADKQDTEYADAVDRANQKKNNDAVIHYRIRYDALKKQAENFQLRSEQLKNQAAFQRQKTITSITLVALFFAILLSTGVFYFYLNKKQNAEKLTIKNIEIEQQKELLSKALKEREDAQAMLVHSEKMAALGQLIAGIAHELKNPINFISGGTSGLQIEMEIIKKKFQFTETSDNHNNDPGVWESIEKLLSVIENGTDRTLKIVNGLKVFSYHSPDTLQRVDLITCLETTLVILNSEIKDRIEVIKEYHSISYVECNIGEISQVFLNILVNAVHAIDGKGTIRINVHEDSATNKAHIKISDSGRGIPAGILKRIFEPFFTTKPVGKGTGLGLSISHKIIEKHKGTISITSTEGVGSEVTIILPMRQ